MSAGVFLIALFINPVCGFGHRFSLVKHFGKNNNLAWQIQAWHWSLHTSSMAWRRGTCLWGLLWTFHLHMEKNSSVGLGLTMAVWKRLMIALSAVARNSGPIALILLWGPSKSHSVGGGWAPYRTSFWVPFNRWALKLSSISWPASSKNMNGFHQLPALSPSKKTFTVGKTNTDNNDINFGVFFSPNNRHLETHHTWTYSVLSCFTFVMFKIFHKTMLQDANIT